MYVSWRKIIEFSAPVLLVLVLVSITATPAPRPFRQQDDGICPNVTSQFDLDVQGLGNGSWSEISRVYNDVENTAECVSISMFAYAGNVLMNIGFSMEWPANNSFEIITARALIVKNDHHTTIVFNFPEDDWFTRWKVIATDYDNYAVIYSCDLHQFDNATEPAKIERAWVLGRTDSLSPEIQELVDDALWHDGDDLGRNLEPVLCTRNNLS